MPADNPKPKSSIARQPGARPPQLGKLRTAIDQLDREILRLLNERAQKAREIGSLKSATGAATYAPAREDEILRRVVELNPGPLGADCVKSVFRELISGCRSLEQPLRVAYLGPEFSYSHLAASCRFGTSADLVPVATIGAVFDAVEHGQAEFGLVPVENSTDGRVADTLHRFSGSRVRICGELPLRIHHQLLGNGPRSEVRQVYSKPQALSQCRGWLARNLPTAELVEVASTSEAARLVRQRPGVAAIASRQAGVHYGLSVLAKNIEDRPDNLTRFAVIGGSPAERTGDDKTALMFEVEHRPGALADAMAIFKRKGLNLTWIESFPAGSPNRYLFFAELQGHQSDVRLRRAALSLGKRVARLEILGSYARVEPVG